MKAVNVAVIALVMISLMGGLMIFRVQQLENQVTKLQAENAALSATQPIAQR